MARDWFWMLAFFPTLAVVTVGVHQIERYTRRHIPNYCYSGTVIGGFFVAVGALLWVDCAVFVDLPFTESTCRKLGF